MKCLPLIFTTFSFRLYSGEFTIQLKTCIGIFKGITSSFTRRKKEYLTIKCTYSLHILCDNTVKNKELMHLELAYYKVCRNCSKCIGAVTTSLNCKTDKVYEIYAWILNCQGLQKQEEVVFRKTLGVNSCREVWYMRLCQKGQRKWIINI